MAVWGASFADGRLISVNCDHECLFRKNSKCNFCGMNDAIQKFSGTSQYDLDRWNLQKRGERKWQPPMSWDCDTSRVFGTRPALRHLCPPGDLPGKKQMKLLDPLQDPRSLRANQKT